MRSVVLRVNGQTSHVDVDDPDMPLLYALRDNLNLKGLRFGCGLAQCGACTVHLDGQSVRSCVLPLSAVGTSEIVTLEGLGTPERPHPLQQAFIDEQAVQCGYCINGMIMESATLLRQKPHPSVDEIEQALANNLFAAARICESSALSRGPHMLSVDPTKLDRRALLRGAGALVVTFAIAPGGAGAQERTRQQTEALETAPTKSVSADAVQGFLAIDPAGQVTVYAGKVDLGTGVETALMQIVADELDVPLERLTVIQGDTALTPDQGATNSSLAIEKGGVQLRHAAATLRAELLRLAAARLDAASGDLRIVDGVVHAGGAEQVDIGMLAAETPTVLEIDPPAPLKPSSEYKLIGASVPRIDILGKVFATFTYMQDFRRPTTWRPTSARP